MSELRIAKRYAGSLLEQAMQGDQLQTIVADMKLVSDVCKQSRDLIAMLKSPVVKADKKLAVLQQVFSNLSDLSKMLINVLLQNKREAYLPAVANAFVSMYNDKSGIAEATVTSAYPLDNGSVETIKRYLASRLGKSQVHINNVIDQKVIGGMVIRYEDKLLDISVAKELKEIRKQLIYN